ncbi:hypothetical protein, partial [Sphingomonas sp.]|uniref:hypothetical protein n=1 Tax=Sphingomonas sp. TaxID=28214 RepID=UPI00289AB774
MGTRPVVGQRHSTEIEQFSPCPCIDRRDIEPVAVRRDEHRLITSWQRRHARQLEAGAEAAPPCQPDGQEQPPDPPV